MPQASDEDRDAWGGENGVGSDKACAHLRAAGWNLNNRWQWVRPFPGYEPTQKDLGAINFLIDEWDFDGIAPEPGRRPMTAPCLPAMVQELLRQVKARDLAWQAYERVAGHVERLEAEVKAVIEAMTKGRKG